MRSIKKEGKGDKFVRMKEGFLKGQNRKENTSRKEGRKEIGLV